MNETIKELNDERNLLRQARKHAEIDEMEGQFSQQLQKIEFEKKTSQANDQIVDIQDEIVSLKDNVHSSFFF
jgi:hypothetical protein